MPSKLPKLKLRSASLLGMKAVYPRCVSKVENMVVFVPLEFVKVVAFSTLVHVVKLLSPNTVDKFCGGLNTPDTNASSRFSNVVVLKTVMFGLMPVDFSREMHGWSSRLHYELIQNRGIRRDIACITGEYCPRENLRLVAF